MMKAAAALCGLSIVGCAALAAQERSPNGVWLRDDGNARVRIASCGSNLCATNLWIKDTSKGEEVGDKLVMSLDRQSDSVLSGTAFDPKRNRTYDIVVTMSGNTLKTRGCVLAGLLCRDVNWSPEGQ